MDVPLLSLIKQNPPSMPTTELSSLKWGEDGELSPNDILNLVEKLMQAEEESRRLTSTLAISLERKPLRTPNPGLHWTAG